MHFLPQANIIVRINLTIFIQLTPFCLCRQDGGFAESQQLATLPAN